MRGAGPFTLEIVVCYRERYLPDGISGKYGNTGWVNSSKAVDLGNSSIVPLRDFGFVSQDWV